MDDDTQPLPPWGVVARIPAPVIYLDPDGDPLAVNDHALALVGRGAMPDLFTLLHADDAGRLAARWQRAHEAVEGFEDEGRVVLPDGAERWVRVRVEPDLVDGGLQGWYVLPSDVTERVRAEQELQASRRLLADAERLARLGSWEFSPRTGTVVCSEEVMRLFGRAPGDSAPTFWEFLASVHPEDRPLLEKLRVPEPPWSGPKEFVHRIVLPGGGIRCVRLGVQPTYGPDGRPERVLGTVQDITAQWQAEEARENALRAQRTLSRGTQVLVHATAERELLQRMCEAVVEDGGYRFAWYGAPDGDGAVRPLAWAGHEEGYLEGIRVTVRDEPEGRGSSGRALRERVPVGIDDIAADPAFAPWREAALARGYRSSLALPVLAGDELHGQLAVYAGTPRAFGPDEVALLGDLAADLGLGLRRLRDVEHLTAALEGTVAAVAATVEVRDPYTAGHQRRVADLAGAVAVRLGVDEFEAQGIRLAAQVHDVGKVSIPAEILTRPGRLTRLEFSLVRQHSVVGADILGRARFPWPIARMVREHHERLDGSGYPDGLAGEAILLGSRIIAVADVVEAMSHHRPYRPSLGASEALAELREGRGRRYDADAVDACLALFREGYAFTDR